MTHGACCLRQVILLLHAGKHMLSTPLPILTVPGSDWEKNLQAAESEYKAVQVEINQCRQIYDNVSREIETLSVSH